ASSSPLDLLTYHSAPVNVHRGVYHVEIKDFRNKRMLTIRMNTKHLTCQNQRPGAFIAVKRTACTGENIS
ncbi:MAG TPA: hypothetical protein VKO43_09350, partial [Candidatus Krumholzibacteriaceae bacterium]|nr:hypothetical protein [Candidatus Krumholzibacteriaceae bacterium]